MTRGLSARLVSSAVTGLLALSSISTLPQAHANDSVAEIAAGGLVLGRTDVIAMESETLYLSMEQVRVDYVFRNTSDRDIETLVAFPMPDISMSPYSNVAIPVMDDNFLGFTVEVDGQPIVPALQQRAIAPSGIDITGVVEAAGLPVAPFSLMGTSVDLSAVPQDMFDQLLATGSIYQWEGEDPSRADLVWTIRSAYYWPMLFPAGEAITVRHSYAPALGGTVELTFLLEGEGGSFTAYEERYCMDAPFLNAAKRAKSAAEAEGRYGFTEATLSYILTTGTNWAGPIETFRLIVDKGSTRNFVSFCGEGVEKTGPTTFELTYENFIPERDMHVLFAVGID